jgi:hypothetical protein
MEQGFGAQAKHKSCTAINSASSGGLLDCLSTHDWVVASSQDSQTMGMVVALKCSRCNLEWSSIISKSNAVVVS